MVPSTIAMTVVEVAMIRLLIRVCASKLAPRKSEAKLPRLGSAGKYTGGTAYTSSADLNAIRKSQ